MLAGLDSRNFAAPIRQILAGLAAHAIGAPFASVLTQPGPFAEHSCGDTEERLGNSASVGPTEVQFIDADAGGIDLSYVEAGLAIKIEPHPRFYTDPADSAPIAVTVAHAELMANDVLHGL